MIEQLSLSLSEPTHSLGEGTAILSLFAIPYERALLEDVERVAAVAPFRHMTTPGGFRMSVAMTNCGTLGWVSDASGYRYDPLDPLRARPWPAMPASFQRLAASAAAAAGYEAFDPDACLVNRYAPGAKLSLHQDKNERDFRQPIVSVSLGLPAVFLFGGASRKNKAERIPLAHGDVVVWGGPARLYHHGVMPLHDGEHPLLGRCRINLTFRRAGNHAAIG